MPCFSDVLSPLKKEKKEFIAKNFNLVNTLDLNRILKSEIFLHTDRQLRAMTSRT